MQKNSLPLEVGVSLPLVALLLNFFGNFDFLDNQHCTFDGDHGVQVPNPVLQPLSPLQVC